MTKAPAYATAAVDQLLAAARDGATRTELLGLLRTWLSRWVEAGTPPAGVDDAAWCVAATLMQEAGDATGQVQDSNGRALDLEEALATKPELHGVVVPVVALRHAQDGEPGLAKDVWRFLSIADVAPEHRAERFENLVAALMILVQHANLATRRVSA